MQKFIKFTVAILGASAISVAAAWYTVPYAPRDVQMFVFEVITIASNITDPAPSDQKLTEIYNSQKENLKEVADLMRKEAWSKAADETGRDIVRVKSNYVISLDPWKVKESDELTTLNLSPQKEKRIKELLTLSGANAVIKDMDGVVKFEYWMRAIPYMNMRKFIVHNETPYHTEDFETAFHSSNFQDGGSLSFLQKLYFPKSFYSFKNLKDGWGIEFGIM